MGQRLRSLTSLLRGFLAARGGNVAMMFGIALVPITITAGAGLDYASGAVVRQQMSTALDAAALAVGSTTGLTQQTAEALAQKYFDANYSGDMSNGTPSVSIGSGGFNSSGSVKIDVTYNLPTTLLKAVGTTSMPVTTSTTVVWGQSKLWVALVLDNSGSMRNGDSNGTQMDALKNASKQLLTILQNASATAGDVKVSIVPFDVTVNVGTSNVNASWIDWRTPDTIRLGHVPTSVTSPPKSEANAIGISRRDTGTPVLRPVCIASGIMMASAPIFLVSIDSTITAPEKIGICAEGWLRYLMMGLKARSISPERAIAALSTSTAAMIQIRSLEKPENILSSGITPTRTPTTSASTATRS